MKFANNLDYKDDEIIKTTKINDEVIDLWISEKKDPIVESIKNGFVLRGNSEGVYGKLEVNINPFSVEKLREITKNTYLKMFSWLDQNPELKLIRVWNFVPHINRFTPESEPHADVYQNFNHARFEAFSEQFGSDKNKWIIPAASAIGIDQDKFIIEFYAVPSIPIFLENKVQVPAKDYSKKYGVTPPIFTRGIVFDNQGQRLLITSGTASIKGQDTLHIGDVDAQLMESINNLRILVSQFNLRKHEIEYGFGLEDLQLLRVYYRFEKDREVIEKKLMMTLAPDCQISYLRSDICRSDLLVEIEGVFLKKGEFLDNRRKYEVKDGKINVESIELHITEHCNLKCHMCDALSPYNKRRFLSVEEVKQTVTFLAKHLKTDVFKILGGEPLLHPKLLDILDVVRESGITERVRVTTNGLLLYRMSDEFWKKLEHLTISNYASAPVKEEHLKLIHEKAKEFNVILNIKYVDQFNSILVKSPIRDKQRVERIYENCWIRHRCLLVRNGVFYKCSRSAYMEDFVREFQVDDQTPFIQKDGVVLDENFLENVLKYLNQETPLESCKYCLGASGKLISHRQMSREEVVKREFIDGIYYKD